MNEMLDAALTVASAPNPAPIVPDGMSGPVNQIIGWGKWIVMALGVIGLLFCAGQMIMGRKNRHQMAADGATGIPWVIGGVSLIALSAPLVDAFI
ncbi:hypothetical protein KGD82_27820 (plasmid) [Nocardiopsis eucommiae]|uniref:Conjugal transfer protein TrbC n=1 Tax=Nocardiopsis eucommiae TaxID=2831970 RepID=A0A975LCW9_9ACTN|nr:hypothetical protein KGD82_27820 [Nocardiopsis eucommiae]